MKLPSFSPEETILQLTEQSNSSSLTCEPSKPNKKEAQTYHHLVIDLDYFIPWEDPVVGLDWGLEKRAGREENVKTSKSNFSLLERRKVGTLFQES